MQGLHFRHPVETQHLSNLPGRHHPKPLGSANATQRHESHQGEQVHGAVETLAHVDVPIEPRKSPLAQPIHQGPMRCPKR